MQKMILGAPFATFVANTRLFQIMTLISKGSVTLAEETQFISVDSGRRVGQYKYKFDL